MVRNEKQFNGETLKILTVKEMKNFLELILKTKMEFFWDDVKEKIWLKILKPTY